MAKMSPRAPVERAAQSELVASSARAAPSRDTATGLVAMGEYHYARSVVQRRSSSQGDEARQATPNTEDAAAASAALPPAPVNATGLPDSLKAGVEALSGVSLDGVKVHYRSAEPAQRQARAYAQGSEIHLAPGEERHLPHEAWHVAQQAQGRVKPTRQLKRAIPVNDDVQLEREADRMGDAALRAGSAQPDASPVHEPASAASHPQPGVMQGVFTYGSEEISDEKTASELAKTLYGELSGSDSDSALSLEDFTLAIKELALYGNHGELSAQYFEKLLEHGIVRETFSFERVGRRLETHIQEGANFPPKRSSFHGVLAERGRLQAKNKVTGTSAKKPSRKRKATASDGSESENDKTDLSYTDLNELLVGALRTIGLLPKDASDKIIEDAVNAALTHFGTTGNDVKLDARFNTDIQLIVHHLLRYQTFNHGPLQNTAKNRDENAFRALLLEQTKEIIRKAATDLPSIVPPAPDLKEGGSLHDALPAPIDSNRALAHSSFTGEIYKGVYKLSQGLLREAYDNAKRQQASTSAPASASLQVSALRSHLNPAFFTTLEKDTSTVIPPGGGKAYATKHANLRYDEDAESFDEAPTDTEWDPDTDTELYAPNDNLERANKKRKTILNTLGVFVKLENQKSALDRGKEGSPKKRARIRRGNDRRVEHLNRHYAARFAGIASESKYRADKISAIDTRVARLQAERAICDFLLGTVPRIDRNPLKKISIKNPARNVVIDFLGRTPKLNVDKFAQLQQEVVKAGKTAEVEQYAAQLDAGTRQLQRKKATLEAYYARTPIKSILRSKAHNPRGWRSEHPDVFGGLGDQGLDKLASGSGKDESPSATIDEEEEEEEEEKVKKPRRNKPPRKRKRSTKASIKGKEKASDSDGSDADDEDGSGSED